MAVRTVAARRTRGSSGTAKPAASKSACGDRDFWSRELRRTEQRYRSAVSVLREGVVVLDARGAYRDANESARRLLSLVKGKTRGRPQLVSRLRWFRPDGTPLRAADRPARRALRTGGPVTEVVTARRRDGSQVWLAINAAPLPACDDGKPQGVVASFADITQVRQAGQALRELTARLLRLRDDEQRRVARQLHDGAAQTLSAATLNLAVVIQSAARLSQPASRALREARALVEQASREVRSLAHLLHPPNLDEAGLASALQWLCTALTARGGIHVRLSSPRSLGRLPRQIEADAFRIVQECLSNVLRHSGARAAAVRVERTRARLRLEVSDRGGGMPSRLLSAVRRGDTRSGIGIASMRERALLLGGTFEIDAGAWGTRVRVSVPLRRRA